MKSSATTTSRNKATERRQQAYREYVARFRWTDGGRRAFQVDEGNDCSVRAAARALRLDYPAAHDLLQRVAGRKPKRGAFMQDLFRRLRMPALPQYRYCNRTIRKVLPELAEGRFIVLTRTHTFSVVDGTLFDSYVPSPYDRVHAVARIPEFTGDYEI